MYRCSISCDRAAAVALAALLALGAPALAGGCSDNAILLTITGEGLAVPADAKFLSITVTAPQGGVSSQQVIGPFDLEDGGLPFVVALRPGVVFQTDVLLSVHTEDADGRLTAAGSAAARFDPGHLVHALVALTRVSCGDDPFEVTDDGALGASINLLEKGNQPDLELCAADPESRDLYNFLVPQNFGLQVVLTGSNPINALDATLSCLETMTSETTTVASNRILFAPWSMDVRTCTLEFTWRGGEPLDASYGFLASVYSNEDCPADMLPKPVPLDVATTGEALSPPMTLCPVELDSFAVTAEFDHLVEVRVADGGPADLSGSIDCPGGAGSMGVLPLYGRTANLGSMTGTTSCNVTVFGASARVDYQLELTQHPLAACPLDGAEPNDVKGEAFHLVDSGWMTGNAGGVTPPLAICSDQAGSADDWFLFVLAGTHGSMQIRFDYDTSLTEGDVDLAVWPPGAESPSLFATREVTTIPITNPPPGPYFLHFTCYAPSGQCGNVYSFAITTN
jgi:hypothetical protein